MASSSRTDSWPRNGRTTSECNSTANHTGVDVNQNKRGSNHHKGAIERKHSDKETDAIKSELTKLKKDWSRLQQEYAVSVLKKYFQT